MSVAYPHQVETASKTLAVLKKLGYAYIYGQPRSGKTLTAILVAEACNVINVMVLTKKQAIKGWQKFITKDLKHNYTIINYEQLGSLDGKTVKLKYNPMDYQLVIIDESHNFSRFPKPSNRYKILAMFCRDLPHLHLSGTPIIESPCGIYHQMNISKFSPFKFRTFYDFHNQYGIKAVKWIRGMAVTDYTGYKPELLSAIEQWTIYMSQEQAGITAKAEDVVHYIPLNAKTIQLYNDCVRTRILNLGFTQIPLDSVMKLRNTLHQLEGGVVKEGNKIHTISNEKIDYILKTFGDNKNVGIMCHFQAEQAVLKKIFKNATIYSSNAHAEGVDLSHLKSFVIYSSDYSGARFVQRRERIMNIKGTNTTKVHHLLVKKGISEQVYSVVTKKQDFNNAVFKEDLL